jgi:hypothetical protein
MKKPALICSLWLASASFIARPVSAAPHTPARGSNERTAIMNSLRRVLGSGRHKAIITPNHFKVERGWAYLTGGFEYEGGARLEPRFTEGSGTNFSALLRRENGRWRVKRRLYNGDVVEPEFIHDFPQAPTAIFRRN